ncbi:TonB-dependent receptor [Ideonella sp. A 288]|uniref:TonB-dependent receptor n=1 Tax=Ideonella sp. A 288 TaxID=1962181 RepID=UPI000B4AE728|nr:TonB-dependent receptor [Ideonella sp. A 288]
MFKKTLISRAALLAVGGTVALAAMPSLAQTSQRVEITGSAIKRVDAETAVPVTVIKIEELKAQGVTSVEQIMSSLSAVQMTQGSSQQVGAGTGGAAFADLRGIGSSKTLVLLNGRRIANNAIDGAAPDLNMIPFAALARVEVLRDGASSLYGTDAIGGVINFITSKEFTGGSVTVGMDVPAESGGKSRNANVGFGFGDLSKQGFNVFGFIDLAKTDQITGLDRPFNSRFPGGLSPTPFPANYFQGGAVGNPAAPNCNDPSFLVPVTGGTSCNIATSKFVDYTAKTERTSAMLRGTLRLGQDHNATVEWFGTRNESTTGIAAVPYGGLWMNPRKPDGTPNPYYPGNPGGLSITPNIPLDPNFVRAAGMTPRPGVTLQPGFVNVRWRALAGGQRSNTSVNDQQRLLAGLEGVLGGWDYQAAISYNENKIKELVSGYSDGNKITQGMLNGIINPFGPQDAAGDAFIADALMGGNLQNHKGKVTTVDTRVSRELGDWFGAGRGAALAVGGEFRREDFKSAANRPVAELLIASTGVDPNSLSEGTRNVTAFYTELSVPVTKQLEVTLAGRFDKYSDFGNTTNPKIGIRFQPNKDLLVRGSFSTGFRAPSLYELNASQAYTNTGTVDDPVNCPNGVPIPGKPAVLNCEVQFQRLTGGNLDLKPEKSKSMTMGIVFEPMANLSVGVDLWWVQLKDTIGALSENTVLGDPTTFGRYINRNASGDLSTDGFSCPGNNCGYLDLRQQNLGGTNANGVDLSVLFRKGLGSMGSVTLGLNSTYMTKFEYQDYKDGPWNQNVGVYSGSNPVFRWQHAATATWMMGAWSAGATAYYKSSYVDQDPSNTVSQYATLDAYLGWNAMKGLKLTFGIKNLTDRDPPYSNQGEVFQANYDPRFADPTGRKYYLRANYNF